LTAGVSEHHDLGGHPSGLIDRGERVATHWQKRMEAMRDCLARRTPPVMHVDEMRRGIEELPSERYAALDPYQRKTLAIRNVLVDKGVLDAAEMEAAIGWLRREREKDVDPALGVDAFELMSEAVIQGLVARGLVLPGELRAGIERAEAAGPAWGAAIVARAWVDANFRSALLRDGKAAIAKLGIDALEAQIVVVENTPTEHNLVVCTLCSCYPRSLLGSPPAWYVGNAYRARAVREPKCVLAEFGLELEPGVVIRVHDSTANMRYLVLPMRPTGTEGWPEDRLARLVTRDCLIGVARAQNPADLEVGS
jgi:nitrile hydratase